METKHVRTSGPYIMYKGLFELGGTFSDPWGNTIGFVEYIEEQVMNEKLKVVIGKNG